MHRNDETVYLTRWDIAYIPCDQFTTYSSAVAAVTDWREVALPCSIQTSPFGLPLEQLYQRDRIDSVRWMEDAYWLYRTTFTRPQCNADEEAVYQFLGVDYHCQIWLNGRQVIDHEGMFSTIEVPLTQLGEQNELVVLILPFTAGKGAPEDMKARYSIGYGWDFAPKLQSRGIWDDAGIVVRPKLHIASAAVETHLRNQQRADALIRVTLSEPVAAGEIVVELDGVQRTFPVIDTDRLALPLNIPSPTLWWPNGMGEAKLVDLHIELRVDGRTTLPYTRRVGLRALDRVACPGQGVEDIPLQLLVNNTPVFLKGVNWVPLDACPGSITEDRYRTFLQQFKDAGVNCIRVWGGGLKEKEAFYRLADEMGLMIMQEFPFACQPLSRSEHFLRLLTQEGSAIIRQLAAHPSVVIWSGGNELHNYWDQLDSGTERMATAIAALEEMLTFTPDNREWHAGSDRYDEPAQALMGHLCASLDGSRPYQLTSAMEGEGEVHGIWTWDPVIGDHRFRDYDTLYAYWLDANQHLYSECSVSSIANLETIKDVLDTPAPHYPDKTDPIWKMHHAFHGAWDHLPDLWLDLPSTEALFGKLTDLETLVLANQWMQGEGGRFLIEELRRKMLHTCGIIWWGINEPWPGLAGNAMIDYFGRPKLGMQFMANAYQPTILSLRYPHCVARRIKPELWISHDGRRPFDGSYEVQVHNLKTGETDEYAGAISCAGYTSNFIRTLIPIRLYQGTRAHIACRLFSAGVLIHKNDYLFASNEDAVPFDETMVAVLKRLYAPDSRTPVIASQS